ncbi:hypothetical protein LTR53_012893 [Teratosphaeriaceae sp. CCFEE 6253]|nr:hypothetical protein LTR53_012893 [Teratosphaeriaceae sp. CCFEE 6253]
MAFLSVNAPERAMLLANLPTQPCGRRTRHAELLQRWKVLKSVQRQGSKLALVIRGAAAEYEYLQLSEAPMFDRTLRPRAKDTVRDGASRSTPYHELPQVAQTRDTEQLVVADVPAVQGQVAQPVSAIRMTWGSWRHVSHA